jgi:chromosome partitioning protein
MKTICIGNEKGGTGKSTITANLAVEAVRAGKKVLVIDADVQQSSIDFRGIRSDKDGLPQFQAVSITKNTIHKDIGSFTDFDLVLIDAGGRDTAVFRSAILAADLLLIPVLPSQYDIWATQGTIEALDQARTFKPIEARFILNQVIPNTTVAKEALEALQEFEVPLLNTKLHSRVAYKQSVGEGKGVTEYENGKAAAEVKALYEEVLKIWQ